MPPNQIQDAKKTEVSSDSKDAFVKKYLPEAPQTGFFPKRLSKIVAENEKKNASHQQRDEGSSSESEPELTPAPLQQQASKEFREQIGLAKKEGFLLTVGNKVTIDIAGTAPEIVQSAIREEIKRTFSGSFKDSEGISKVEISMERASNEALSIEMHSLSNGLSARLLEKRELALAPFHMELKIEGTSVKVSVFDQLSPKASQVITRNIPLSHFTDEFKAVGYELINEFEKRGGELNKKLNAVPADSSAIEFGGYTLLPAKDKVSREFTNNLGTVLKGYNVTLSILNPKDVMDEPSELPISSARYSELGNPKIDVTGQVSSVEFRKTLTEEEADKLASTINERLSRLTKIEFLNWDVSQERNWQNSDLTDVKILYLPKSPYPQNATLGGNKQKIDIDLSILDPNYGKTGDALVHTEFQSFLKESNKEILKETVLHPISRLKDALKFPEKPLYKLFSNASITPRDYFDLDRNFLSRLENSASGAAVGELLFGLKPGQLVPYQVFLPIQFKGAEVDMTSANGIIWNSGTLLSSRFSLRLIGVHETVHAFDAKTEFGVSGGKVKEFWDSMTKKIEDERKAKSLPEISTFFF